jgi:fluoroacetyl-CoA thioesterase
MTAPSLSVGLRHEESLTVSRRLTVPEVSKEFMTFEGMPAVFATALMIAFVEETCIVALRPYLRETEQTVGTHVDMSHCAPTPLGMTVTAEVTLIEIRGRRLVFAVECRDDLEVIGCGRHERTIVDRDHFAAKAQTKRRPML